MVSIQPTMQHNMHLHEDLAALFSRNLTFNPDIREHAAPADVPRQEPQQEAPPVSPQPIIYSISQHYHHSAHTVRQAAPQQEPERRSSAPPQGDAVSSEAILRSHGVDPACLTPSQMQLFRIADEAQKMRLLELWSICPPTNGGDIPALAWSSTTMEQEEQLAQIRYERLQHGQDQTMSLDGTTVQTNDGRWQQNAESEPYMTSGYEELMRREQERLDREKQEKNHQQTFGSFGGSSYSPATDPVYMGADYTRDQQQRMAMATQYGNFEQKHGFGDMDSMDVM
jgi:hypothetical protein